MIRQGAIYWLHFGEPEGSTPAGRRPAVVVRKGEGGLPRRSVVNVSQLRTVDRQLLQKRIGELDGDRIRDVLRGVALVLGTDRLDPGLS